MHLAGIPIGPRKLAGLAVAAAGLAGFAAVTVIFGLEVALLLVAALLSLVLLGLAAVFVEARRQHRTLSEQNSAIFRSADAARRSSAHVARRNAEIRRRIGQIEESVRATVPDASAAEEQALQQTGLDELRQAVRQLSDLVEVRLAALEASQRRTRDTLALLRAEQRRWLTPDAPALHPSADAEVQLIADSALFDREFYRRQVGLAGEDPVAHYVRLGASLGLNPHPLFASGWYLSRHPDALQRWRTPLGHFLVESDRQDLDPHPAFWSRWYAERHLDGEVQGIPVEHFLQHGADRGFDPNPLFDTRWYVSTCGQALPSGVNPLVHYLTVGAAEDRDPSPAFHTADVRRRLGNAADPLSAFLGAHLDGSLPTAAPVDDDPRDDDQRELNRRWEYLTRGLYREPDTFVLYRIIGNDLPPRHREGQSLENLRFILDHEPDLPGCEKRFVVNRITDPAVEKNVIALLEERGAPYIHIPFDPAAYRKVPWHFAGFDPPGFTYRREFAELDDESRLRAVDHTYHHKNRYVMNNNGARNAALVEGRRLAKWVLPWDGNCFVTRSAWDDLVKAVTHRPHLKYFAVPMARVVDNNALLAPNPRVEPSEEPQLLFRRDAEERFDPNARYGRRPKVYLFYRLGVRGRWDTWKQLPYEPSRPKLSPQAGPVGEAGWVARLFSGERHLEASFHDRGARRVEAIHDMIDKLDAEVASTRFDGAGLFGLNEKVLAEQRERYKAHEPGVCDVVSDLISRAERSVGATPYTVTTKTSLPPSGDPHDYWHPAPYWWPNPGTADGLPYVQRDGIRVPGTILWEPGSEQYDRSALQSMIDETTYSALAGYFTDEGRYYERGADLLRTWFLAKDTRMNPHLRYAQVRRGHNQDEGNPTGVLEAKDFYYLLDAARLVERSGTLSPTEARQLREWFAEYRTWLQSSTQGQRERSALNNHGTWYDVQVAAIDAYLNDVRGMLATLRRSFERIGQQFQPDGSQPEELRRSISQHYCSYNLQGWITLALCASCLGHDLWAHRSPTGSGLTPAAQWVLGYAGKSWPYDQIDEFDPVRWTALFHQLPVEVSAPGRRAIHGRADDGNPWHVRQVFTPHDGIRPYWLLGSGDSL